MANRTLNYRRQYWGMGFGLLRGKVLRRRRLPRWTGGGTRRGRVSRRRTGTSRPFAQRLGLWWWVGGCRSMTQQECWRGCRRQARARPRPRPTRPATAEAPSWTRRPATSLRRRCPPRCCPRATAIHTAYCTTQCNNYLRLQTDKNTTYNFNPTNILRVSEHQVEVYFVFTKYQTN